jgi:hypothetical protein
VGAVTDHARGTADRPAGAPAGGEHRTLYDLLGVAPGAPADDIRAAYRRAARRAHPDVGGSEGAFRRVNAAYRVLGDPDRRRRYDLRLTARSASPPPGRPGQGPTGPGTPGARPGPSPRPAPSSPVPRPDARARRHYFVAMGICVTLFVLAGAVVRLYSTPAAIGMMLVAMVIPPAAAIAVNRPPRDR